MRNTERKRAIVEMLEQQGEAAYAECGPPPFTATTIARQIGGGVQSVSRTLRSMASDGVLVAVDDRQEVWNAIAQGPVARPVVAYFSAATMERDIELAAAWKSRSAERSRAALDRMSARFVQR